MTQPDQFTAHVVDLVDVATSIFCAAIATEGLRVANEEDVDRIARLSVRAARAIEAEVVSGEIENLIEGAGRTA